MTDKPEIQKRSGRWRYPRLLVVSVLCSLLIGAAVAAYALWQDRTRQLEMQLTDFLASRGMASARVSVRDVATSGLKISLLEIGDEGDPDLAVEGIRIGFSLWELFGSRVRDIHVDRLLLRARFDAGELIFGDIAPLFQANGTSNGTSNSGLPFERLEVDAFQLDLTLPEGPVTFNAPLMIFEEEEGFTVSAGEGCVDFATGRLNLGGIYVDPLNGALCLQDRAAKLTWPLESPPNEGNAPVLSLHSTSSPVHLRSANQELMMSVQAPDVAIEMGRTSLFDVDLALVTAEVRVPDAGIGIADVSARVRFPDITNLQGDWMLERGRVVDASKPPRFEPLLVTGKGSVTPLRLDFDLSLADNRARRLGQIIGSHNRENGRGKADLSTGLLAFDATGLQPQNLIPALAGVMTNVIGGASGDFKFAWHGGNLKSQGRLRFDQFGFSTAAARSEGISGTVELSSLMPPQTAIGQTLSIGSVDAGLLLSDGKVQFSMKEDGAIVIDDARWPFAGGVVRLTSGSIVPGAAEQSLQLSVERVDLAEFLPLFRLEGVSGTGIVSGLVPISIRDGDVWIEGAVLRAADAGQLSYKSAASDAVAEGQSALLFQALEDFQYTGLEISLDGNVLERLNVGLKLQGANPTLYDGYPFAINVTTEASFAELMRSATVGTRALDLVREFDLQHNLEPRPERGAIDE
ncbi:MAG: YdbH domain-containing protein [Parvibaculum sp.]